MKIENRRIFVMILIFIFVGLVTLGVVYHNITSRPVYKAKQQLLLKIKEKIENHPGLNIKDCFVSYTNEIESGQHGYHIYEKDKIRLVYDVLKRSRIQDATGWQMKPAEYLIFLDDINIGAAYGDNFILMYSDEECIVKFDVNDNDNRLFSDILKKCRENAVESILRIENQSDKSHPGIINISDSSLEKLIRYELNKPKGRLTEEELESIRNLSFQKNGSMLLSYKNERLIALEKEMGDNIDLSELKYLPNLESVSFYGIKVKNMSGLKYTQNLKRLSLWDIGNNNIEVLKDLHCLTELHLGYNSIEDISAIEGLTQLEILRLTDNNISNIESLRNLTKLTQLCLEENRIRDIEPLKNLTNLTFLRLDNNQISDIHVLMNMKGLELLYIQGNRISDYSPLDSLKITTVMK